MVCARLGRPLERILERTPPMSPRTYAGDVTSEQAWHVLSARSDAVLIDVRSDAEWAFVGLPDLSALGKRVLMVSWQAFPDMGVNPAFMEQVRSRGVEPERTVFLICRSGQRSRDAAMALTAAGYGQCFNVADGFEGPHDSRRHRGCLTGWKAADLPWVQG